MSEVVVKVKDLSVRFGDFTAVDRISFTVTRGEVFGFLGANGAGKTTTIRVLCGLLIPSDGEARVCGLGFADGGRSVKEKVGYMSQKFTLYDDLTVSENLDFTASLRKMDETRLRERSQELLDFIEFRFPTDTLVRDLPGGVKQQVSLAASLLHSPEVVFLDEPTAGVTPAARARFWALIRQLVERGTTVFVTTHYMDEAEQCGRIALMRAGQLIALDSPDGLKRATFPQNLLELTPLREVNLRELERLRHNPAFTMFQPHGSRWHAEVNAKTNVEAEARAQWQSLQARLKTDFAMQTIRPSLEDVFIRLVEGRNR